MNQRELPKGWDRVRLGEVVELNPRKPAADLIRSDAPVTFVPMAAVDERLGAITAPEVREFGSVRKGYTAFQENDVIFAKITPCMENGKAAVAQGLVNGLGFGSTEFHVLRPTGAAIPAYLYYYLRQESFRRAAEDEMTGSVGQKRVPAGYLLGVKLPLPPCAEQRRIVAKLEEVLAQANAVRERLERVLTVLKRFRQSVLAAAYSGRLTEGWREEHISLISPLAHLLLPHSSSSEIPDSWCWTSIGSLASLITKGSSPGWQGFEYTSSGTLFVRSQNIRWGELDMADCVFVPNEFCAIQQRAIVQENDVLLNLVGASVGRSAVATKKLHGATLNQAVAIIRPRSELVECFFLMSYLLSPKAQDHIAQNKADVARANFNLDDIKVMPIPLPPYPEQQEITQQVNVLRAWADAVQRRVEAGLARVEKLTQAVLEKAFRGELVTTEAELARQEGRDYEPASVLLDRIRAERGDVVPKTSRGGARRRGATQQVELL